MNYANKLLGIVALTTVLIQGLKAQDAALISKERKHYKVSDLPLPDSVILEVGGFVFTEYGKLGVATRRGEI